MPVHSPQERTGLEVGVRRGKMRQFTAFSVCTIHTQSVQPFCSAALLIKTCK